MAGDKLAVVVPPEEKEMWQAEAEELNTNLSAFVRTRIRAGRILLKDGDIDVDLLDEFIDVEDMMNISGDDSTPETLNSELSEQILCELPVDGSGSGVTEEELRELIFGSETDQLDEIKKVCKKLDEQGEITRTFGKGLVKTDD